MTLKLPVCHDVVVQIEHHTLLQKQGQAKKFSRLIKVDGGMHHACMYHTRKLEQLGLLKGTIQ
jgi:hypothetical protein